MKLFTGIEDLALRVAGYKTVNIYIIRHLLGDSYYKPYSEMLIQLIQLGIVSKPRDMAYNCDVLVKEPEKIKAIIERAR